MPNRIIKESSLISRQLASLSHGAERTFWRLIVVADDFGRFAADPVAVKSRCYPLLADAIKSSQVKSWLAELIRFDLVKLYTVEQNVYGFFVSWDKHQQRRALKSKFPDPLAIDSNCNQLQANVPVFVFENENENDNRARTAAGSEGLQDSVQELPFGIDAVAFNDFREHRKKLRRPMSQRAEYLALQKLDEFRQLGYDPVTIINQSIMNGWQGLFLPKSDNGKQEPESNPEADALWGPLHKSQKIPTAV